MPLFNLRLEALFVRYMGEAATQLELIFDKVRPVRGASGSLRHGGMAPILYLIACCNVPHKVQYRMTNLPKLQAVFYRTGSGKEPVRDWLLSLKQEERREIGTDIAYVQFKWPIGKPRVDHLRGNVWEVRTRLENRIARVLFAVKGGEMVLLHGFIKKTQKTPDDEIDLAETRWKEWQHGEGK